VLKFQGHVFEELPHLAGTASQSRQLKDAVAGLGDGVDRLLLEGLTDQLAIGSHLALGTMVVARPETLQAPRAKGDDVPRDGGPTDAENLGRFFVLEPAMQQPEDQQLLTDSQVGMSHLLLIDDALLFLGQVHSKPGHGEAPRGTSQSVESLLSAREL
jgi:hypothetical protein